MSEAKHTSPVRFSVLDVNCRWCGVRIEVQLADGLSPGAALAECERQSEEKHPDCPKKPTTPAPPYFEPGFDDQADEPTTEKDPYT